MQEPHDRVGHVVDLDRPIPAQAPILPLQQRVGDPVAQLLVGQGAMSHLLIQMAQEMNRRTVGQGAGDHYNQVDKVVPPEEKKNEDR